MNNETLKKLRLHNLTFNPCLNDGRTGLMRVEANQWITDINGNVTDVKHRLEAYTADTAFEELERRAAIILSLHTEQKPRQLTIKEQRP